MRSELALSVVAALLATSSSAAAFCRTTTVAVPADFSPEPGVCFTQGNPLFWRSRCVTYRVNEKASRQVPLEDARRIFRDAFARWTAPSDGCSQGIDVVELSPTKTDKVEYRPGGGPSANGNERIIVFRDDVWPHSDAGETLELTTVTFQQDTGEILDADIEVNAASGRLSTSATPADDSFDLASIATHAAGHFLGLSHSADTSSTMRPAYEPGSTAHRAVAADDQAGMCSIYPSLESRATAAGVVPSSECLLTSGDPNSCGATPVIGHGCAVAAAPRDGLSLAIPFAPVAAWLVRRARRRVRVTRT